MIRPISPGDIPAVVNIYNHYIENTVISFEEQPVSMDELQLRVGKVHSAGLPWLVAEDQGAIVGYAYAGPWNVRSAYRHSAEITVYLSHECQAKGWGTRLYQALFARLKDLPIHTVMAGVALPNPASVAIHEKFGMTKAAHFSEVGYKFGQWIDVGYWQVNLE